LWPEVEPADGRNSLRQTLFLLRRQLEPRVVAGASLMVEGPAKRGPSSPAASSQQPATVLLTDRSSVQLNPEAITTDVAEFQVALRAAKGVDSHAEQTECLARAVQLYPGE